MNNTFYKILGLGGIAAGLIGVGYALGTRKKLNDISDKLDKSIDELSDSVEVDIPQSMIDKAVERAVDREVQYEVKSATVKAVSDVKQDIHKEISRSVNAAYSDVKGSVTEELRKQVARVDINEAKREVIRDAKETASQKFESSLDEILEKFNGDLNNISTIYRSIATAITKNNDSGKDITLKLT